MQNKRSVAIILTVIMLLALVIRIYNFHDWLYFKMDQARDAMLIRTVLDEGPGYLPLLGPRAGATEVSGGYLRLGPIFYYFQYLSALIFGLDSPAPLAYPDLFFSMLAIPALYLLSRLYFSRRQALLVTAMYAFSFLVIQYSRFAWNPNALPFFTIICFYGLLKFFNAGKIRWLALWAGALAVGSQLHFFGFFTLAGISGLLIAHHLAVWQKEFWQALAKGQHLKSFARSALACLIVFAVFYFPVVISDIKRGGENAKNFVQALSSKPQERPLLEKIGQNVERNIKYFCLVSTSGCYKGNAQDDMAGSAVTILIMFFGIAAAVHFWKKSIRPAERNFTALLVIWLAVFFILTIPVSFQLRPRFFLPVFPLPFLLLGLIFKFLEEKMAVRGKAAAVLITAVIMSLNASGTLAWFQEQKLSQEKNLTVKRTLILKTKDGVTLSQLERAADYIAFRRKESRKGYFYVKPEHVAPFKYLLAERTAAAIAPIEKITDTEGQYFAVVPADRGIEPFEKKFGQVYEIIASQQFGQISVFELSIRQTVDNPRAEASDDEESQEEQPASDRVFWKDIF